MQSNFYKTWFCTTHFVHSTCLWLLLKIRVFIWEMVEVIALPRSYIKDAKDKLPLVYILFSRSSDIFITSCMFLTLYHRQCTGVVLSAFSRVSHRKKTCRGRHCQRRRHAHLCTSPEDHCWASSTTGPQR